MNIDKLTKKLNEFQEKINKYQVQLDILNGNNRSYSYFKFVMSAKMSAWGQSEMPNSYYTLPLELEKEIAKMYKEWLDKEIGKLKTERENLVKGNFGKVLDFYNNRLKEVEKDAVSNDANK